MHIKDRTFVISGASSGLGYATAQLLHKEGGYIALLDINEEAGQSRAKEFGPRAKFFETDVTSTESIATAVKGITTWLEETGKELGGVIPAAGVGNPTKILSGKGEPAPLENIDFVININLRGTLDLVRQLLPAMARNAPLSPDPERGVVVLVSSSAAFDGQPGQVAYSASKGAIASLTLPMARDLAQHGIRVVTIAPSLFETSMTAMMGSKARKSLERVFEFPLRGGQPEEFASIVKEGITNKMLNGTVIRLDGGMRMPSKM